MTHKTIMVFESDWEFVTSERKRLQAELNQIKEFFEDSPSSDWFDYLDRHDKAGYEALTKEIHDEAKEEFNALRGEGEE